MFSRAVNFLVLAFAANCMHLTNAQCDTTCAPGNDCVCCGRLGTAIPPGVCVPIGDSTTGTTGSYTQVECGFCQGNSGKPTPGNSCDPNTCPSPLACCAQLETNLFPEGGGTCRNDFTPDICQGNGGIPQDGQNGRPGPFTDCANAMCPPAVVCCAGTTSPVSLFPDGLGQCLDVLTENICMGNGATVLGEVPTIGDCTTNGAMCPQPVLCCGRNDDNGNGLMAGTCRDDVDETFCQGNSGKVLELLVDTAQCTTTETNPYDDPCPPAVACCPLFPTPNPLSSDMCVDNLAPDLCLASSGLPLDGQGTRAGPIANCDENPCTVERLAAFVPCCGTVDRPQTAPLNPPILAEECAFVTAQYCLGNTGVPQDGQNGRPTAADCDTAICVEPSAQPSKMPSRSSKMPSRSSKKNKKSTKAPTRL